MKTMYQEAVASRPAAGGNKRSLAARMRPFWLLYLLLIPILAYYCILRYYPMVLQIILSFKQYTLMGGVWGSKWVGVDNFNKIFSSDEFYRVLFNTLEISLLRMIVGFLPPIILAIMLFDLHSNKLRRFSQTILYIPHFFSWVVIYGVVFAMFSNAGFINQIMMQFGGEAQNFLLSEHWFRPLVVGSAVWKEIGWGTIIYLAGLTMIDTSLFDAAKIDGAGPFRRIWHVTLPGIRPVIIFLFTLSLGGILNAGGEQILLFYSPATYRVGDIIDTFVYRQGLAQLQYSLASTVSLFQSFIGIVLILVFNRISKKTTGTGIW
ncbi:ABC transporter permease [Paenibacillus sp. GCM10027626]|uniref:ABC transporter permease n=1 Tax=Paenibacillus sp. GCM10027626 TaxID=3273411 RepID=UPI003624D3C9